MGPTVIQECEVPAPYSPGPGYGPGGLDPRLPSDHAATSPMPESMNEIVPEDTVTTKRILSPYRSLAPRSAPTSARWSHSRRTRCMYKPPLSSW